MFATGADSNLKGLVGTIYSHPEVYGEVSAKVLSFLHLQKPIPGRGVRWNAMRRWMDGRGRAGSEATRVTNAARAFFAKAHPDGAFVSGLADLDPDLRFFLSPRHTGQLLEFASRASELSRRCKIYLTVRRNGTLFLETDQENLMNIIVTPRGGRDGGDTPNSQSVFGCEISGEICNTRFLASEIKHFTRHAATAAALFRDRIEFYREGIVFSSIRVRPLLDGSARHVPSIYLPESLRHEAKFSSLAQLMSLSGAAAALDSLAEESDSQNARYQGPSIGPGVIRQIERVDSHLGTVSLYCSPPLPERIHMSGFDAATIFEYLDLPIKRRLFKDEFDRGWLSGFEPKKKWAKRPQASREMFYILYNFGGGALFWARYIPGSRSLRFACMLRPFE